MVKLQLTATDTQDTYQRFWGVFIDQVPTGPWWRSSSGIIEKHRSGDIMSVDQSISDGDHKVYIAISQDGGSKFGSYSGFLQLDTLQGKFSGVDVNTIKEFDISVKDNAVTTETAAGASTSPKDKVIAFVKDKWKWFAVGGGILLAGVIGLVLWKRKRRGF